MEGFWNELEKEAEQRNFWVTCRGSSRTLVKLVDFERVSFSVTVSQNRTWKAKLFGVELDPVLSIFCLVPKVLDNRGIIDLFTALNSCETCPGNPDFNDVCRYKASASLAVFCSNSGEITAREVISNTGYTVRHVNCQMIISKQNSRCDLCKNVRSLLSTLRTQLNNRNNNSQTKL